MCSFDQRQNPDTKSAIIKWIATILAAAWMLPAYALPNDPGDGTGGGVPAEGGAPQPPDVFTCLDNARATIFAAPDTILPGSSATLSWSVQLPDNCTFLNKLLLNNEQVPFSGSRTVQPKSTTDFRLTMQISVTIRTLAATTVNVTLPRVVHIDGSTSDWRALLVQAVGTPPKKNANGSSTGMKVILAPNVDMDMSYKTGIQIAAGVTLTSEMPLVHQAVAFGTGGVGVPPLPLARNPRHLGPRLYTTTRPKPLFQIVGDHVLLEGFRLEGPDHGIAQGDEQKETGILMTSQGDIEIQDMELSGWGGTAISVRTHDPSFDAIRIHDNFFTTTSTREAMGMGLR